MPRRSAYFFLGRLDPPELANFQLQNVLLNDRGAVLEIVGHGLAIWWPSLPSNRPADLIDAARAWPVTIASAYYLETEVALRASLVGWVEALDVHAREAVIGFVDPRFHKVEVVGETHPVNDPMRRAVRMAIRLRGAGELERAANELLAAANEPSPQGVLGAYRALECVRRVYEPAWAHRQRGWTRMRADLHIRHVLPPPLLGKAAEAVRHGDLPVRASQRHVVNQARRRQGEFLRLSRTIVQRAITRHLPAT